MGEVGTESTGRVPELGAHDVLLVRRWLALRSRVTEFDWLEHEKIGGETPYSRRALAWRIPEGQPPGPAGAVTSALCYREQSLREDLLFWSWKTRAGEVGDGCSDEVQSQRRPRGKVSRGPGRGRLPPPPLFPTFTGQ